MEQKQSVFLEDRSDQHYMTLQEIGKVVELGIQSTGMTKKEYANHIGYHKDVINSIVNGKKGRVGLPAYEKVLKDLNLSVSMHLPRIEEMKKDGDE